MGRRRPSAVGADSHCIAVTICTRVKCDRKVEIFSALRGREKSLSAERKKAKRALFQRKNCDLGSW